MFGKVIWFDAPRGYGFVKSDTTGDEFFTHFSAIQCDGYKSLKKDDPVEFEVGMGPRGKIQVESVRVVK